MDKEEKIIADYKRKRQALEDQEDTVRGFQKKGEELVQDTLTEIRMRVQHEGVNNDSLDYARRELAQLETVYTETLAQEKRKLVRQQDDNEQTYRRALQQAKEK